MNQTYSNESENPVVGDYFVPFSRLNKAIKISVLYVKCLMLSD